MNFTLDTSQAVAFAGRLVRAATKVRPEKLTRHYGQVLVARARAKASGRPGPNAPTGQYRNSLEVRYETDHATGASIAVLTSPAPQARRLEFGFKGVDSLGRSYNQPPYPHMDPALREVAREFPAAVERTARDWMGDL